MNIIFKKVVAEKLVQSVFIIMVCIQGVPGGMDKTSGECSLC